jgi:hypothetical protein
MRYGESKEYLPSQGLATQFDCTVVDIVTDCTVGS